MVLRIYIYLLRVYICYGPYINAILLDIGGNDKHEYATGIKKHLYQEEKLMLSIL